MDQLTSLPPQILSYILRYLEISELLALRITSKLCVAFVDSESSLKFIHLLKGPISRISKGRLVKIFGKKDVEREILGLNTDLRSLAITNFKLSKEVSVTLREGLTGANVSLENLFIWNCSIIRSRSLRFLPQTLKRVVLGLKKPFKRRIISALGELPNLTDVELEILTDSTEMTLGNELDQCSGLTSLKLKNFELPNLDKLPALVHLTLDIVRVNKTFHLHLPNLVSLKILRMNDTRDTPANDIFILPELKSVEITINKSYTTNKRHQGWISKLPSNLDQLVIVDIDGLFIL